ncbi:MAG: LysE family translocator, partial [Proteobacteria bacterium]|nr:LysE family translocator [Pseudomonadota bacterium]
MSTQTLAALALASLIWMAAPGPGVFAVVARSMAFGARSTLPFVAGIVLGDLIYVCFAVFGLALVANLLKDLFVVLHWAAAAYLIFLGIKAWRAPIRGIEQVAKPTGHGAHAFVGGLFLTLGNPKVVIFYLSALPAFVDLPNLALPDGIAMTATMLGVLVLV